MTAPDLAVAALLRVRDDLDAARARYEVKSAESHGSLMAYYADLASGLREAINRVDKEIRLIEAEAHRARLGL